MALSGMTGFSRTEGALGAWSWGVEARSVNGRNLEVRFRGPPGFDSLDRIAREAAQARFQRGQVTVGLMAKRSGSAVSATVNAEQLERYLALAEPLVREGRASPPDMAGLLALPGVVQSDEGDEDPDARAALEAAMAASVAGALDALKASRDGEGAALTPVLTGLLDRIEQLVAAAETEAATQPGVIKDRFKRRMAELVGEGAHEERIVQEAAAMAVKADVREELDRLGAHIGAARTLIASDAAAGRRLDFLMQEFMREANTLCSKSATTALTAVGLDLKAVIEQLREQTANVE
ncbi:MAG TPA: YicC/YloC family endoribonuclease [Caulobacteraceae bacterium]|nr:YicC/YloC family endoribonuclease [Caulobacteraceae bacterium]